MAKTKVYSSYSEFLSREDETENGVSQYFAEINTEYEKQNETNEGCWNCESCEYCKSCESCESCEYCKSCESCESCEYCKSCESCKSCEYCEYCKSCESCEYCKSCEYCEYCKSCESCESDKGGNTFEVPVIENIHAKVLAAVSQEDALDMSTWHTCDSTHCRAGWVVVLAGKEGRELEAKTSTSFAAMCIYNKSSQIKVPLTKFYENNEDAMGDIVKCADEEKKLTAAGIKE